MTGTNRAALAVTRPRKNTSTTGCLSYMRERPRRELPLVMRPFVSLMSSVRSAEGVRITSRRWRKPAGVFLRIVSEREGKKRAAVPEGREASEEGNEGKEGDGDGEYGDGASESHAEGGWSSDAHGGAARGKATTRPQSPCL